MIRQLLSRSCVDADDSEITRLLNTGLLRPVLVLRTSFSRRATSTSYTEQPGDLERSSWFHVETWASPGQLSTLTVVDCFALAGGVDLNKCLFWNTPAGKAKVSGFVSLLGLLHSCWLLGTCLNSLWNQMGHVPPLWQFQTMGTSLWETATVVPFLQTVIFIMNCLNPIMF